MRKTAITIALILVVGSLTMLFLNQYKKPLEKLMELEIEKTRYKVELETLEDAFHTLSEQLALAEAKAKEDLLALHQENEGRESQIKSLDRQRGDLLDELEYLRSQLRKSPPPPNTLLSNIARNFP
jgi:seryl-tRNA synthetase